MVAHGFDQVSGLVRAFTALVCWRPADLAGFFVDEFCGAPVVDELRRGGIDYVRNHE